MEKSILYQHLKNYLLQKKVTKAAVFGSFARNEENDESDIDLLIDANGLSMFDILRIEDELESIFKRKIDLVEFKAVKSSIRKYVFENTVELI
ncbi:nucleotidyltransferase domain-containing protein [Dyadobacter sp. CY107]|uniref:nucleotidyltransferase family protein n=1 Tax=Dyadobacter fanqingshengii TaxID=2906443 RepID=UPI001F31E422|nr:nucleotidyltransferase domain-containing protein [Dyadobacter fanqingshengii]MCF2506649.1 nucleotidyltransferase domain-containing protein [Dyadobacter fanqingshengii]